MEPYHVIHDTRCTVKVHGFPVRMQLCRLIWNPRDPAAVMLRLFEEDGGLNDWIFARKLLVGGLSIHNVHGDVTVKHYQELQKVRITLSNNGDSAVLEFDELELSSFLQSTLRQIDFDSEAYDMDDTIRRLLSDD